jgi:hypothetical protein
MKMEKETNYINPRRIVKVGLGTTGTECLVMGRSHEQYRGLSINQCSQAIGYDAQNIDHTLILPTVDQAREYVQLMPHEQIHAALGDYESRLKLERQGKLWMEEKDFAIDPGIADKDIGAGGNIRYGHALFAANTNRVDDKLETTFKNIQDYSQQLPYAHTKVGTHTVPPCTDVITVSSSVGGMATGALSGIHRSIAEKAIELKNNIKITSIAALLGTLNPGGRKDAALNQYMFLKSLLVRLDGKYHEPHYTNGHYQQYCQPPIFVSNCNDHGELPDLRHLQSVVAQFIDLICYEPFGEIFFREIINLHKKVKDDFGANRIGSTFGLASTHFNRVKVQECITFEQGLDFFTELLKPENIQASQKEAQTAFEALSLKETHRQDLAVQHLLSARSTTYKNAQDRAIALFRGRITTNFGFRACEEIHRSSKDIRERQLPAQFIPAIPKEADSWFEEINQSFNAHTQRFFQTLHGIGQAVAFWEEWLRLTIEADKLNHEKLAGTVSNNQSLRTSVSQCEQDFARLEKRHPFWRTLSFGLKSSIKRRYPRYTEALIQNELELKARKLLSEVIYPAVKKLIIAQLEQVNKTKQTAFTLKEDFGQKTERLKNLPDWLYCPNGVNLADKKIIEDTLQQVYSLQENKSNAIEKIFEMLCGVFGSLHALTTIDIQKIKDVVYSHCRLHAQAAVSGLNVLDVILARYSTEQHQYELISKMVAQSDGLIKVSGENSNDIPKKKYVLGPDERTVNWGVDLANKVSRRGGDFKGIVCNGLSGIYFIQYRSLISVSQLMADTAKLCNLPTSIKELVKLGDDPFVITTPRPGCDIYELDRLIAEGIAANAILEDNGNYIFAPQLGESINLGKSIDQIRKHLQSDFYYVTQIHNAYARHMILNHQTVSRQIQQMVKNPQHLLLKELDVRGLAQLEELTEELLPYARRIQIQDS